MIDGDWEMMNEFVALGSVDIVIKVGDRGGLAGSAGDGTVVESAGGRVELGSGVATDSVYHSRTHAS